MGLFEGNRILILKYLWVGVLWRWETDKRILNKWLEEDHFELIRKQPKQRLTEVWSGVQKTVVDEATDEWRWKPGHVSTIIYYFVSAAVTVDSSHMTASSSTS